MRKIILLVVGLLCFMPIVNAEESYEAKINEVNYATIEEAVTAATEKQEITLLSDIDKITVSSDKNIVINFNNHTVNEIENAGALSLVGAGTLDCSAFLSTGIKNSQGANLTIDGIEIKSFDENDADLSTGINNEGTLVIKNTTVSFNDTTDVFLKNSKTGIVTIEGGNYSAADLFRNEGKLTINGGSFILLGSIDVNTNYGNVTINNGTFNAKNWYFVRNEKEGNLVINGGSFTGQSVVWNYGGNATTTVNGGNFNVTDTAFLNNAGTDLNQNIIINGGNITSTEDIAVISSSDFDGKSKISINGGTIKGNNLFGKKIVLGVDDDNVSTDLFKIDLGSGGIGAELNIDKEIIEFYDGKIILGKKELSAGTVIVPDGYQVQYDDNGNGTYTAYLVKIKEETTVTPEVPEVTPEPETPEVTPEKQETPKEEKPSVEETVENPPTGLYFKVGALAILFIGVIGFIIMKKKNYFSKI